MDLSSRACRPLLALVLASALGAACDGPIDDAPGDRALDALRVGPLGLDGWSPYLAAPRWTAADAPALDGGTRSAEAAAVAFLASRARHDERWASVLAPAGHAFTFIDIVMDAWDDVELVAFQLEARRAEAHDRVVIRVRLAVAADAGATHTGLVELVRVANAWYVFRPPT